MKLPWFKRNGIFFIPISIIGWTVLLGGLAYVVYIIRDIDSSSHSASDTLINFVFYLMIIEALYSLIAYLSNLLNKS